MEIEIGKKYSVTYPFTRCKYTHYDEDGGTEIDSWKPGCEAELMEGGETGWFVDGEGEQIFEVISIHKPGSYPERVFYLRTWKSPDGDIFGKPGLKITTAQNFRRMLKGYRYDYEL